jgi:hypothetical protein
VSRPVDSLDSPSWPPRSSKGANSKKDLVMGPIGVFVPYRSARPPRRVVRPLAPNQLPVPSEQGFGG